MHAVSHHKHSAADCQSSINEALLQRINTVHVILIHLLLCNAPYINNTLLLSILKILLLQCHI